ncbi:hypothetical protein V6N13_070298 [Hibiscus sabdariffa]
MIYLDRSFVPNKFHPLGFSSSSRLTSLVIQFLLFLTQTAPIVHRHRVHQLCCLSQAELKIVLACKGYGN